MSVLIDLFFILPYLSKHLCNAYNLQHKQFLEDKKLLSKFWCTIIEDKLNSSFFNFNANINNSNIEKFQEKIISGVSTNNNFFLLWMIA